MYVALGTKLPIDFQILAVARSVVRTDTVLN
jgi:hypothetical protein